MKLIEKESLQGYRKKKRIRWIHIREGRENKNVSSGEERKILLALHNYTK